VSGVGADGTRKKLNPFLFVIHSKDNHIPHKIKIAKNGSRNKSR
jgi:hypothetical protein